MINYRYQPHQRMPALSKNAMMSLPESMASAVSCLLSQRDGLMHKSLPIAIRADAATSSIDELTHWVTQQLQDKNTYLVTTIDLSHYLPAYLADIHDRVTIRDLLSIDPERWQTMEIDNPPIARITLAVARELGLKGTLLAHTNSLRLAQSWSIREGTSHAIDRNTASPGKSPSTSQRRFIPTQAVPSQVQKDVIIGDLTTLSRHQPSKIGPPSKRQRTPKSSHSQPFAKAMSTYLSQMQTTLVRQDRL
jgi:hypothetical protein